jgi:hypothetical protein
MITIIRVPFPTLRALTPTLFILSIQFTLPVFVAPLAQPRIID